MRCVKALWAVLMLAATCSASADEVIFKNGDRLTGKVERLADGELTINSWSAGKVTVEIAKVRTISTDAPIEVHFRDGTVIKERVSVSDEGRFAIERGEVLEAQVFAFADVVAINPPEKPKAKWKGDVTAGVAVTRSNTDTEDANMSVNLVRSGDVDRITFDAALLYGRQEDPTTGDTVRTKESWFAEAKYDYFLSRRLFAYVNDRVERDRILDLDLRLIVGAGIGREWVETPAFSLRTEAGLAWLYEDFTDETDANKEIAGRLAYRIAKSFSNKIELSHALAWYPTLEDFADYFLTTEVDLRASLTSAMFADFKVVFDYDSTPATNADKGSLKSVLGIGLKF